MKLLEVFRFEFSYQIRRPWPWLSFVILLLFAFFNTRIGIVPVTLPEDFILNSPFIIAAVSVSSCMIWLVVAPAISGEAGARDVYTGMFPLAYTAPVSKTEYLGGRFLAAFVLNALVLLGVQAGNVLAAYAPGVAAEIIGPFRPAAYIAAYVLIALPNAFIVSSIQFSSAVLSGRIMASYFGSVLVLFLAFPLPFIIYVGLGQPSLAKLVDPVGFIAIMNTMFLEWTIVEKNVRMFTLEGPMLVNRLVWLAIAALILSLVHLRFRFAHRVAFDPWSRLTHRFARQKEEATTAESELLTPAALQVPKATQSFTFGTHLRQTLGIASSSFWMIARSPAGLFLLAVFPAFLVLVARVETEHWGVPLVPKTGYILAKHLTAPLSFAADYRVIVVLLILYLAGELIWRERDAGLSENVDATAVPDWVLFAGKYLGLSFILGALMVAVAAAGMITQLIMGYYDFEPSLYLRILFGLQLPEYLLFAVLALLVQAVVNQKHLGMLAGLLAYFSIIFSSFLGVEHKLLVYGSSPEWTYSDIRGFANTMVPWAWFKLYWVAWALLLAVVARLFWMRGRETAIATRIALARQRFAGPTAGIATFAALLVVALGGFVFYNTNVVNDYRSKAAAMRHQADYEKRYGAYEGIPQPRIAATKLHIEVYPERGAVTFTGTYRLTNDNSVAIDSLHVEPAARLTTTLSFDRPARQVIADEDLRHSVYKLEQPLAPGDSMLLSFDVRFEPRGFGNDGPSTPVVPNGSYFTSAALPVIGYQAGRELTSAEDRRAHGLPRQVTFPMPEDVDPGLAATAGAVFDAVIGTEKSQVAVAPGALRREWTEGDRRYFHYSSDVPITGQYTFFSADYEVHRERWNDIDVAVFLHPTHTDNLDRLLKSARASLAYYTTQFGPYPHRFLQFIEQPGNFLGMGVDGSGVVTGGEGIFLLKPAEKRLDAIFEITAHEIAHLWWGGQLKYAPSEGAIVISESLAWYSAMKVVQQAGGRERLRQFKSVMRQPNPWPPIRTGRPLLRAMDPWAGYRKGPFALDALSEYMGENRVNGALKNLIQHKTTTLATSLDLYRELKQAAPEAAQSLLHDLFEVNTFWTFDTKKSTAAQTADGKWEVTLEVEAKKVVADSAGKETELPMTDAVEIGIFAPAAPGEILGKPLHLQKHRIRSGLQTIVITVSGKPGRGGIDPYNLLDWEEGDNIEPIEIEASESES